MREFLADFRVACVKDPLLMAVAVLLPLAICLVIYQSMQPADPALLAPPRELRAPKRPEERPPADWRLRARPGDILTLPGRVVHYWGNPAATYSRQATVLKVPPRAIILHYTLDLPPVRLIKYQHNGDARRGGHFGYHFYVSTTGAIYQGAPLSVRTNHIKRAGHRKRREGRHAHLDSSSTIGVALVGGCDAIRVSSGYQCRSDVVTSRQATAASALVATLQQRFVMGCREVYGHGELQTDRAPFEGITLTRAIRGACGP